MPLCRPADPTPIAAETVPPGNRIEDHVEWVLEMAAGVCRNYHLDASPGSPDLSDVHHAGLVKLIDRWSWFQPEPGCIDVPGAFRGYVHRTVLTDCQRQAERLCNGGTYHCRRRSKRSPVFARPFSALAPAAAGGDDERGYEPDARGRTVRYRSD